MASEPQVTGTAPMDYKEHEATFALFVRLTEVLTPTFITIIIGLAIGWVKGASFIGSLVIIAATVAGAVGLFSKSLGWKPALGMLVISLLCLLIA